MAYLSLTEVASSQLSSVPIKDGQLIFCRDTGNFYKDDADVRNRVSSDFETVADLPLAPLSNKLYLLLPNRLFFFGRGEWIEVNESPVVTKDTIYSFPTIGRADKIYIATKTNETYRWDDDNTKYYCVGSDYHNIEVINCGGASE